MHWPRPPLPFICNADPKGMGLRMAASGERDATGERSVSLAK